MGFGQINLETVKRYMNPQSFKDVDKFMDAIPGNVGYNAMLAVGMSCLLAAGAVFFAAVETEKVTKLHTDLMQVEALRPPVPVLKYMPVDRNTLVLLTKKLETTYKGVALLVGGDGDVTISAVDTDFFPQFLAAISYLQRGGRNWKVRMNTLCVGRACAGPRLSTNLKIEVVRLGEPETQEAAPVGG